ncbi:glycoside hydrolase family 18 protein [Amanita thiersii Skay4041]|uniref:Glycoside hydrolase family 18 protein n=1 Tax=Amanita thiersii Skay4041 TaxID=703135 RepID=A0A2A9NLJ6_9AGAR|nr:glycoside hydrolase family 18 protein [Amanita thiersii Skay4041]
MKTAYNNAGIKLIVGALTSSDADAKQTAQTLANWVKQYDLDGIDVGFGDPHAFENGSAEAFIAVAISIVSALPWVRNTHHKFCPNKWPGGGYLYINKEVGSMIDWYNIQFYNWGESEYTDCNSLLFDSSSAWPQSSIFQINANGVDLSKLVTGKPATTQDAVNGYIDPSTFAGCLSQAKAKGWDAGVAGWQWPRANNDWFRAIRAQSWPCGPFGAN